MAVALVSPVRCLSSHLTTELLRFRNPQGAEENWLVGGNARPAPRLFFAARAVATEVGAALLVVSASVETVAYGVLLVGTLCLCPLTSVPLKRNVSLLSSSGFTIYWNLGNALVFNPFCKDLFTHESFARFSIDHWPRGTVLKTVVVISYLFLAIVSRSPRISPSELDRHLTGFTRLEDSLYIADWARRLGNNQWGAPVPQGPVARQNPAPFILRRAADEGQSLNQRIDAGATFIKEYILAPGQITEGSKQLILECDAEIYHFILTRTVYLYVFGAKRNAPVPSFLRQETQNHITRLRREYRQDQGNNLSEVMKNHTLFDSDPSPILNQLKIGASAELQGGIFTTRCLQAACS